MRSYGSLCVLMGLYASIRILMSLCGALSVVICPYELQ